MSRLTEFAVSKRSVTLLLALAVFLGGIYSWGQLKQELLPDIQFPVLFIFTPDPGASARDVTEQVTKPIERAIGNVARLERLQSTSANSVSIVVAQFSYGTDVKGTRSTIEQAIAAIQSSLPSGSTPQVSALDINASPVIVAAIQGVGGADLAQTGQLARTVIVPELQGLDGVSQVDVTGGLEKQVDVVLDPTKLAADGVSVSQVNGVLQANNLTIPSGQIPVDTSRVPVSTTHSYTSVDQIANQIVGVKGASAGGSGGAPAAPTASTAPTASSTPGASTAPNAGVPSTSGSAAASPAIPAPITVADLGAVAAIGVPTTGYSRTNGQESLTITVSKASDANTVDVANAVTAKLKDLSARYPGQIKVTVVSDLSTYIKESSDGLVREGGLGAVMAIIVIFLFLASLRSTFVAAMSIPLSIMAALCLMLVGGISINIMTLGGLAVAVGRVVDDAIVVLENIYRHRSRGEERMEAVLSGAREVAGAITASTATTVAVFLPLGFVGGIVSQFFLPFALTVTFALLASLVCALTVVPVLAYFLVDRVKVAVDADGEPKRSIWVRAYSPTIRFVLRSRWTRWGVIAVSAALFFATLALVPSLPTQFINPGGEKIVTVSLVPPPGTSSADVLKTAIAAEKTLLADPKNVTLVQTSIPSEDASGSGGFQGISAAFSGQPTNTAVMQVRLDPSANVDTYTKTILNELAPLKQGGYDIRATQLAGFSSNSMNVVVSGPDQASVKTATEAVMGRMAKNPDLINLKSDLSTAEPQVEVQVDPNKAILTGFTTAQIGGEIRTILVPQRTGTLTFPDGSSVPLTVQIDPRALGSVAALKAIPVGTAVKVPLGAVADVQQVDAQGSISRIGQAPAASVTADITSQDTGAVSRAVQKSIDQLKAEGAFPAGVSVTLAGVTQQQSSAFSGLFASMAVAILLVYVMMVLTFNSLVTPFIILFSLPLATIGAFIALYVTHRAIGISALIGFLMLIGIVVTNAIVLLDLVERLRRNGLATDEALVHGGHTRVRPILMTAFATILALIPLGLGLNQGSIIASELATVVIGGLFSSTFLTLLVVPVVYSLVEGGKDTLRRRRHHRAAHDGHVEVAVTAP